MSIQYRRIWWFLCPWAIGYAAWTLFPLVASFTLSLTTVSGTDFVEARWAGAANYRRVSENLRSSATPPNQPRTALAFRNTLTYVLMFAPGALVVSVIVGMALYRARIGGSFVAMLVVLPSLVNGAATALIWSWFLNPEFGLANATLRHLNAAWNAGARCIGFHGGTWALPDWFFSPMWAKPSLAMMSIWTCGGSAWVISAALRRVPKSVLEASVLDGADAWRRIRHVLWPALTPVVLFLAIIDVVSATQAFTGPFMLWNRSQADSLLMYSVHLYQTAFESPYALGYASALAWSVFAALALVVSGVLMTSRFWVSYDSATMD